MVVDQAVVLNCDLRSLSKCDRCILNLLRPHLTQENDKILQCSQIQQILAQFKEALEHEAVISLATNGKVKVMTQRAKQLLHQYFSFQDANGLPDVLKKWLENRIFRLSCNDDLSFSGLSLCIEKTRKELIIRLVPEPNNKQFILLLEEKESLPFPIASLEVFGLTERETEVLSWIVKDKSNAEISRVLGCREGTVRKHLENIYKKLDVQTRVGAIMFALENLGLLKEEIIADMS